LRSRATDAAIIACVVFAAFAGSAILVFWVNHATETERIRSVAESAAWRSAAAIRAVIPPAERGGAQALPDHSRSAFEAIKGAETSILNITLVGGGPGGIGFSVLAGSEPPEHHKKLSSAFSSNGRVIWEAGFEFLEDGTLLVWVPVSSADGHVGGAVRVASRPPTFVETLGGRINIFSILGIGFCVAALAGFLIFNSSGRFHSAYQRLAEAEKRLRDVTDAAGEYIWEVDEDGRYTYLSERVREVLDREPADLIGHHPMDFVEPASRTQVSSQSEAIVANKSGFRDFEYQTLRKDGSAIWLSVNGVPVCDDSGRLLGYRGAAMDITQRKRSEDALIREKEAAQAAAVAKSQFLAMMSHEIRTPLNSVLGFAELLSVSDLDPVQREQIEMIRRSGDALLELLNDILDFSRAEAGSTVAKPEPTELAEFVRGVMALHTPAAALKSVSLEFECGSDVPRALWIDRARFRQILLNLVGNAVKFTDAGGVKVRLSRSGTSGPQKLFPLKVAVQDSGIGIPEDKTSLLFKPFSQVDSSTTRKFGGTGLGLVICRRLAEILGGTVFLESSSRDGSTFVFECSCPEAHLPVAPGGPRYDSTLPADWVPRVLVVEDNLASRKLMRVMLGSLGLACEDACNGVEAVEAHAKQPFDVIFMDLQMPEMDGLTASRRIRDAERSTTRKVQIIALTADAMAGDRERCLEAGMDDYLSKPVRKDSLLQILRRIAAEAAAGRLSDS